MRSLYPPPLLFVACLLAMAACVAEDTLEDDLAALLKFKNDLANASDFLATWDGNIDSLCTDWVGVGCETIDNAPRVTSLTIVNDGTWNDVSGQLPVSISNLTALQVLRIEGLNISGPLLFILTSLSHLESLTITGTAVSGSVPPSFGTLSNLVTLDLSRNLLTGYIPPGLGNAGSLVSIKLSGNRISGTIPGQLSDLSSLDTLDVSDNRLTGPIPAELVSCPIRSLQLARNNLNGTLEDSLFWEWCNVPGQGQNNLTSLDISGNQLSGPLPPSLSQCTNLETLSLAGNQFSGHLDNVDLSSLTKLQILDLSDNALTGLIPADAFDCCTLPALTFVDLSSNFLQGSVPQFPNSVSHLNLAFNSLKGSISGTLPPSLVSLNLSWNGFSSAGQFPPAVTSLTSLQILDLSGNLISGNLTSLPPSLPALAHLNLSVNSLTGQIPDSFSSLSSLSALDLSYNGLSGALPASLANLSQLASFSVAHNQLVGPIPGPPFSSFPLSSFTDNEGLCGAPTEVACPPPSPAPAPAAKGFGYLGWLALLVLLFLSLVAMLVMSIRHEGQLAELRQRVEDKDVQLALYDSGGAEAGLGSGVGAGALSRYPFSEKGVMLFVAYDFEVSINSIAHSLNNFDRALALHATAGSFGNMFRAQLADSKTEIAVKVLPRGATRADMEVQAHLVRISSLTHANILPLVGAYVDDRKGDVFLFFPFVPSASLDDHLMSNFTWTWQQRYSFATGAARGLNYLHKDASPRFVIRNFKASNLLVGDGFSPLVSDWCLTKIVEMDEAVERVAGLKYGARECAAPEMAASGIASTKSDVYAYGIVLLQIITGKCMKDLQTIEGGAGIVGWAKGSPLDEVVDPRMSWRSEHYSQVLATLKLALMCTQQTAAARPPMEKVLQVLQDLDHFAPKLPNRSSLN